MYISENVKQNGLQDVHLRHICLISDFGASFLASSSSEDISFSNFFFCSFWRWRSSSVVSSAWCSSRSSSTSSTTVGHGESDLHPYAAQHPTLTYAFTRRTSVQIPIFVRTTKQEFIEFFVRTPICSNFKSFENRGSTVFKVCAFFFI